MELGGKGETAAQAELRERLNNLRWQMQNCAARNDPGSFARLKQEYLSVYNIGEAKLEALDKRLRLAGNQALQAVTAAAENINQAMQRLLGDGIIGAEAAMAGPRNPFGGQLDPFSVGNGGYAFFAGDGKNENQRNRHELEPDAIRNGFGSHTKSIYIPQNVERKIKKLSPEAKRGYEKAISALRNGDLRGLNAHGLSGNRSGQWAIDIKGTGQGRGGGRIIYAVGPNGEINIIEILTKHDY